MIFHTPQARDCGLVDLHTPPEEGGFDVDEYEHVRSLQLHCFI